LGVQYGTGKIRIGVEYVENKTRPPKIEDFDLMRIIGKGGFRTMQVSKKDTKRIYAMKTIPKACIISQSEVAHTLAKKQSVLLQINNPFIVPLKFTFQSPEKFRFTIRQWQRAFPLPSE
jgi:serum/glucocorticoid-regulated kinase 2